MLPVLNHQEPQRVDRNPEGVLNVHSYFHTIQGEGPFAGSAAFFVRLHGCNLQCPGCDTEYTRLSELLDPRSLCDLVHAAGYGRGDLVVITGGEPFRQNVIPAVWRLITLGYRVQIETNGVLYPEASDGTPFPFDRATIVCSPKTGKIHPKLAQRVSAYKYVLEADDVAEDGLPIHALGHDLGSFPHVARPPVGWQGPIFLQPMDEKDSAKNERNVQAVVMSVMKHRKYIMGVQMHKITGLP